MRYSTGVLLLALLTPLLAGCSDDDTTEPAGPGTVVLRFDHVVGDADFTLHTGSYTNAAGNSYTVSKLEYVLSDFMLTGAQDVVEREDPFYRDAGDTDTRELTMSDVPSGVYTQLRFTHGIPGAMNEAGAFPALDNAGMAWPEMLGGGYHYMRHEGAFTTADGSPGNFTTHTGPTGGTDFSVPVTLNLPPGTDVQPGETLIIELVMDVNGWYQGDAVYDFNDHGRIMGNPVVQAVLQANGAGVWSVRAAN